MVTEELNQGPTPGSPRACGLVRRLRLAGPWLTMAAAVLLTGGCWDQGPDPEETEPPGLVSDPVSGVSGAAAAPRSAAALAQASVAYVSLWPDSIPNGEFAVIRNARGGDSARTAMAAGGFDPIAVVASAGDSLALDIQVSGGEPSVHMTLVVPEFRKPRVVRTRPIARKRDVVLNARPVVVFTEPIDPRTIGSASVRLLRNGAPVNGQVTLSADALRAELQPNQPLEPNTDYVLAVTTGVADVSGDALAQAVQVEFTTGTTTAVAMAYTDPAALFSVGTDELRTFAFSAILHDDGRLTGTFDGFNPSSGASLSGRVSCFAIEEGNLVWMAGVIEQASWPESVGHTAAWRAIDRGPPDGGVRDLLSFAIYITDPPQEFCAKREGNGVIPAMFEVERGEVVIQPPAAGPPAALTFTMPPSNVLVNVPIHPPIRVAVVDASGNTVPGFSDPVTINAFDPDGAAVPLSGEITVTATGGVAVFRGVGVDRVGTDYVIAATAAGLSGVVSGPFDVIQPSPGLIAFSRLGDGDARLDDGLYLVTSHLSDLIRISAAADEWPAWSPDGARLAFQRSSDDATEIYVMGAEGSVTTRLTNGARPAWSPDGARIAFMSDRDSAGRYELYVMNQDGTGVSRLTTGRIASRASWSPDGTRLAFTAPRDSIDHLYVVNADGSDVRLLVDVTSLETCIARDPAWSPDGTRIAFSVACVEDFRGIYVVNPDGSGLTRINTRPSRAPAWSPDGRQIAFDRGFEAHNRCYGDLWLMNADGSGETRLDVTRQGIACSRMPAWRRP